MPRRNTSRTASKKGGGRTPTRKGTTKRGPTRRTKASKRAPKGQSIDLDLFHNIQFIYELHLAKLELDSFGVEYKMDEDMRAFRASKVPDKASPNARA